jgi:hypothetical protein
MSEGTRCSGEHSFYMASEIELPNKRLALVGFCTHCATPLHLEFELDKKQGK